MADFADEKEDKYVLSPEEEAAFASDIPDGFLDDADWKDKDYDILGDDSLSDGEFDGMLQEIADTKKDLAAKKEILPDTADTADTVSGGMDANDMDILGADAAIQERNSTLAADSGLGDFAGGIPALDNLSEAMGERENSMATSASGTENEEFGNGTETQEDILDLINSLYTTDEEMPQNPAEDNAAGEQYGTEDELEMSGQPDFADMLENSLPDDALASIHEIGKMGDEEEETSGKKKKKKKKEKVKKPSILKRLFGNIKTERSEEEIAQMKEKIIADAQAKEAEREEKVKKAAAEKEEKKKKAAEEKAAAAKKKQENAKKKEEAAKAKKEAKKEAKDKKKQEVQNLIDAIDEDEGRINRVGAAIIFVLFAAVAVALLVGTSQYSYKQSVANARKSFEFDHYNEAYEEISGLKMKKEDKNFEMQVLVVMYTYKQLNSFNNFYEAGLYPEALDSLIKGLEKYNKYSPMAAVVEVQEDMESVRGEILGKLDEVYSISEQEALTLMAMKDQEAYSRRVYELAEHANKSMP